jgi:hypothetical protein
MMITVIRESRRECEDRLSCAAEMEVRKNTCENPILFIDHMQRYSQMVPLCSGHSSDHMAGYLHARSSY